MKQINEIDAVGNVKIFGPQRLKYFLATLESFSFLKNNINLYINIENGKFLKQPLKKHLLNLGFKNVYITSKKDYYYKVYTNLLRLCRNEYILNLEDDHFCVMDSKEDFFNIINEAYSNQVEILRSTFFKLNNKNFANLNVKKATSIANIYDFTDDHISNIDSLWFIENNSIFRKDFAKKYWGRVFNSNKPHPFEIVNFDGMYKHHVLIPKLEILKPIDDDHGIQNSSCLKSDHPKWTKIISSTVLNQFRTWIFLYNMLESGKSLKPHLRDFLKNKLKLNKV